MVILLIMILKVHQMQLRIETAKVFGIIKLLKLNIVKKNERMSTLGPQISKIYLTNLPGNFNEKEIIKLCENFGEITSCQISTEIMLLLVFLKLKVLKWHKEI